MKIGLRLVLAFLAAAIVSADQTPPLHRVMREKLKLSQEILAAVITSDWTALDRESHALEVVIQDPAWSVLTAPEYIRQSDAFKRALRDLTEASAKRDLDGAAAGEVSLTLSCVECHKYMTRQRLAR